MTSETRDEVDQLIGFAGTAYVSGNPEDAIEALERAARDAKSVDQLKQIARTHKRFGRIEHAASTYRRILAKDPLSINAHVNLAQLSTHESEDDEVRALVALHASAIASNDKVLLGFALGKLFEDLGQYDRSFAYYAEANATKRRQLGFSSSESAARLAAFKAAFSPALFERMAGSGQPDEAPIFIVGVPRSGSTLTEQILASHPLVFGGGETDLLDRIAARALRDSKTRSLSEFVGKARTEWMRGLADIYMSPFRTVLGSRTRFTDKNLSNLWKVGLIKLIFPNARIVHCVRDPLDNCFSIYRRFFSGDAVAFGYDLTELGTYYGHCREMMLHWDSTLPGFIYQHSYEALIADLEGGARSLLAFCALDWDARCLEFQKTERGIDTASVVQVRQPLYDRAVGSAIPFMDYLKPLIGALGSNAPFTAGTFTPGHTRRT